MIIQIIFATVFCARLFFSLLCLTPLSTKHSLPAFSPFSLPSSTTFVHFSFSPLIPMFYFLSSSSLSFLSLPSSSSSSSSSPLSLPQSQSPQIFACAIQIHRLHTFAFDYRSRRCQLIEIAKCKYLVVSPFFRFFTSNFTVVSSRARRIRVRKKHSHPEIGINICTFEWIAWLMTQANHSNSMSHCDWIKCYCLLLF